MPAPQLITLDPATSADSEVLSNLLELYIHDLSAVFPNVELGANGRFGYEKLPSYWREPNGRFAFLIRADARIAGFALVTRGSPASDDPDVLDIAEFFVLRRYRRVGVGGAAALLLWNRLPGSWIVRASEGNRSALAFWTRVIAEFAGAAREDRRDGSPHPWRVFSFNSLPPAHALEARSGQT